MRRSNTLRRGAGWGLGLAAVALLSVGADDSKQTIKARGLTFEAPKSWKSSEPSSQIRIAQLKVDPAEGDDYPAEMVVTSFSPSAGTVDANIKRWQNMFKDESGNPPSIETKKVEVKNVEVVRAETHGEYHPAQFGAAREPVRKDARFLGAIITADGVTYYIRMVGPDRTMKKLAPDFDELLKTISVEK
jgi:hypothetical protein